MKPKIFPKCTTTKAHTIMTSLNKHCTRFPPNSLSHTLSSLIEIFVSNSFLNISNTLSLSLFLSLWPFLFSQTPFQIQNPKSDISVSSISFFLTLSEKSFHFFLFWVLNFFSEFIAKAENFSLFGCWISKGYFFFLVNFFFFGVFIRRLKKMIRSRWWSKKTVSDFQFGCTENGCFGFDFAVTFLGLD